jgi:hypothetical protein
MRRLASNEGEDASFAETAALQQRVTAAHHLLVANRLWGLAPAGAADLRPQLLALLQPLERKASPYLPSAQVDAAGTHAAIDNTEEAAFAPMSEAARALNQALSLLDSGSSYLDRESLLKSLSIVWRMAGSALRTPDASTALLQLAGELRAAAQRAITMINDAP